MRKCFSAGCDHVAVARVRTPGGWHEYCLNCAARAVEVYAMCLYRCEIRPLDDETSGEPAP